MKEDENRQSVMRDIPASVSSSAGRVGRVLLSSNPFQCISSRVLKRGGMCRIYISGPLIHHSGHSLTYNCIPQVNSQECHTIKFREIGQRERIGKLKSGF